MMTLRPLALIAAALALAAAPAPAPDVPLGDPAQESHARALFREVRCLVCQNESIDDSEADLAADLRRIVRSEVAQGRSDAEIKRFLVERYGQFVLFRPAFDLGNAALWLAPFLLIAATGGWALTRALGKSSETEPPLDAEEEARLAFLAETARKAEPDRI